MESKKTLTLVAVLVAFLALVPSASASKISWSGYSWSVYSGTGNLGQPWRPDHVQIKNGHLFLVANSSGAGGVGLKGADRVYGKWSVTYKVTGQGKYDILLNPAGSSRPEIDFAEGQPASKATSSTIVTGTYHPKPGCISCIHAETQTNTSVFHTFSVTHTPTSYILAEDGVTWKVFTVVNTMPLHLHMQTAGGNVTLEISKVVVS